MVNGKPGDSAFLDIVEYKIAVFSSEIDALVREVDSLGGFDSHLARYFLQDAHEHVLELRERGDEETAVCG